MDRDAYNELYRKGFSVREKVDLVVNLCRGRKVLDLGCIDHSLERAREQRETCLAP